MDYIIDLPETQRSYTSIITAIKDLSAGAAARPMSPASLFIALWFILEEIICKYGLPLVVISDLGIRSWGEFNRDL